VSRNKRGPKSKPVQRNENPPQRNENPAQQNENSAQRNPNSLFSKKGNIIKWISLGSAVTQA
jgi:hypothetical protein